MIVINTETGGKHIVVIEPVESKDFKIITKERYFFDWNEESGEELYKLRIVETNEILGLVSFEIIPEEWRIHLRLISVSVENKGTDRKYQNIAGNLITFVSKIAVREFAEYACVSLKPKGVVAQHYIDKYGMNKTGTTLSIEIREILNLIKIYDHD